MSINRAHCTDGSGVVLFFGERLLIYYSGCEMKFHFDQASQLSGSAKGSVYLTTHRTICICKSGSVKSLSMPLLNMKQVEVKQPVFGANRIEGKVTPEPDGGFAGMCNFYLTFNKGGAIEFAQCLLEAGRRANANRHGFQAPPPYSQFDPNQLYCPPPGQWEADANLATFIPQHDAFARPDYNSVYVYPAPPPYPGASQPPPYPQQQPQGAQPLPYPQAQTAYYNNSNPHEAFAQPVAAASAPPAYEEAVAGKQHAA